MQTIRNTYGNLTRVICFVFALHIFNLSIDPKDKEPAFIPEDLSVNDIESLTELVAEVVLGFTNAFAEHDEADDGNGNTLDFHKFYYSGQHTWHLIGVHSTCLRNKYFVYDAGNFALPARKVSSPPPEA